MASKKQERLARLVDVLKNASAPVPAASLARMLDTSERTIRNYVTQINEEGSFRVESSNDGYRLAGPAEKPGAAETRQAGGSPRPVAPSAPKTASSAIARRDYVVSRLIVRTAGVEVFEAAKRLHISESTFASSVMPQVRQLASQFGLSIETHNYVMTLKGNEQDKRRLMGFLATHDSDGYFSSTGTLENLFPEFDVEAILSAIVKICQDSELLINDFALNNLLIHLLVIVVRLKSANALPEGDEVIDVHKMLEEFSQRDAILRCANGISSYFEREFGCLIPDADYRQIVVLIALSVERCSYENLNLEGLADLIDQDFLDLVKRISDQTVARYGIPAFDEPLLLQLTLHVFNAVQRAKYRVSYPNPLAHQIKHEYAPVYDMAVYFAHQFTRERGVSLDENEIAFIAFHIGAYLERCPTQNTLVNCVVLVDNYHGMAPQLAREVQRALGDDAVVSAVMTRQEYMSRKPEHDFIVCSSPVEGTTADQVVVGPILTRKGERAIREKVEDVLQARKTGAARLFLKSLFSPDLYVRNIELEGGRDDVIDYLASLAEWLGYADEDFVRDVHAREAASSTAFTDCLAVPHSIGAYAKRSFIAVLHNDAAIAWGNHGVKFVLLIGIAEQDMAMFRGAFDLIVETFMSVDKTAALLRTTRYDDFVDTFLRAI